MVRPFRAPHHSATAAALVGGGSPPRPGEISLAHAGVLFLDELPELPRAALEALREPLETGRITISRAARQASFPARFQLIAAMNPCPCGYLGAFAATGQHCRCTPDAVARYQGAPVGPAARPHRPAGRSAGRQASRADGRRRRRSQRRDCARACCAARQRQQARQGCSNAELPAADLERHCALDATRRDLLQRAAERLGWSGRGLHRVLQAWPARSPTWPASEQIRTVHIAEAMQWRRALPAAGT